MTERYADDQVVVQGGIRHAVKRRGILAAAAVVVAGIAAKQTAEPVAAASSFQFADTTSAVANNALGKTSLIAQSGFIDPAGFLGAATVFAVDASGTSAPALVAIGARSKGSAAAISGQGGTNGPGIFGTGGTPSGDGVLGVGAGAANPGGTHSAGVYAVGGSSSGSGVEGTGGGPLGIGVKGTGAASGIGVQGISGDAGPAGVDGLVLPTHVSPNAIAMRARDQSTNGTGIGVQSDSTAGIGGQFAGGKAPLRLVPQASGTGAPTTGTHSAGEFYVDSVGALFYCVTGGTPGTWQQINVSASALITLPLPERFVDTRTNLGGLQGPAPANTTHTFQMTGRTGQSGNAALIIPDTAKTLVGNVTVIGAAGIPLGSFLTIWPGGAQPTVSNINYGPAATSGAIANTFVIGLTTIGGHGNVNVFNLSVCDYILDVTGYFM